MLKLKLGGPKKGDAPPNPEERPAPDRKPSVKLSFKPKTPGTENPPSLETPTTEPKAKKKPSLKKNKTNDAPIPGPNGTVLKLGKKRALEDGQDEAVPAKRQVKPTPRALSFKVPTKAPSLKLNTAMSSGVKLKFGQSATASATTPRLKVRAMGKKPTRVPGVGYDSEDDEREDDPSIESQFVLRMQPGADCDYLRQAIAESAVKHRPDGTRAMGPDVWMRFFDKEGRHGVISVRGNLYATSMLDLPCVIEAMKSWDKKGWYKTADICQILLVLGRVDNEDQAKNFSLPPEVDRENWQYPHGLTPPMQWVRRRRFRRRINRRMIERVEADVEEVVKRDLEWERDYKGSDTSVSVSYVKNDDAMGDEVMQEDDNEYGWEVEDQDGNVYEQGEAGAEEEEDDFDLGAELEAAMFADESQAGQGVPASVLDTNLLHASPDTPGALESATTPASGVTMSATEDDSQDDDDDEDDDEDDIAQDDEDDEDKAQRQEREQALAEIRETKKEIAEMEDRMKKQGNSLLKNRLKIAIDKLKADLSVKVSGLGMEEDD